MSKDDWDGLVCEGKIVKDDFNMPLEEYAGILEKKKFVTKNSGKREEFDTGSKRDSREGKGRFDLISPIALRRLAGVYERGATKYGDRNWEKGQKMSRILDSALRHLNEYKEGWRDEDHLAQAMWNVAALIHFEELRPDLNDLPMYMDNEGKVILPL